MRVSYGILASYETGQDGFEGAEALSADARFEDRFACAFVEVVVDADEG